MSEACSNKQHPALVAELKTLIALPNETIDYSNIPANTPTEWWHAQIGYFYRPLKKPSAGSSQG